MPDPNKHAKRVRAKKTVDAKVTPKVRRGNAFTGTQGAVYSREYMSALKHNRLTNDKVGASKFKNKADSNGVFSKGIRLGSNKRWPSTQDAYKGGMR